MEERLAIIFRKQSVHTYGFKAVALVDFDEKEDSFIIKNGDFKGFNEKRFSRIKGPEEFIYDIGSILEKDGKNKQYLIYVMNNNFLEELLEVNDNDINKVYVSIARKAERTVLIEDEILHSSYRNIPEFGELLDEEVYEMLYGKENEKKDVDSSLKLVETEQSNKSKIDVAKIADEIERIIVGQGDAIKVLLSSIYFNQLLIDSLSNDDEIDETKLDSSKISILLDGSTGTGKTAIAKNIAKKLSLPIEIVPANSFSETGYVGPTITDILVRLINKAGGDIEKAERGIVVLDEIDKIADNSIVAGRDMKKGVQEELLGFISGGKYEISGGARSKKIIFDTSKLTFIMNGAFTDLRDAKIREIESSKNPFGFSAIPNSSDRKYTVEAQDYIDFGLVREFIGRIKVIATTKSYTKEDLIKILLTSEISPLRNFEDTIKILGYPGISYDYNFIEALAQKAYEMNTGARALQTIMSGIQSRMLFDLQTHKYNTKFPIELNEKILDEYEKVKVRTY